MLAAMYLRISEDRTGEQLGVVRQREDCEELCRSKGWGTPVPYIDNDTSATNGKPRPAYAQMLSDIRAGSIAAVVSWDLDRLHRRPVELEEFMQLADAKHLHLATVSGDVDLSTAQGRLVARLKGSVAAHEGEHRKARQLRAACQRADQGVPNWSRAFGYLGDTRQLDPQTAPLVRQAYLDVLAGASLTGICRQWNADGVCTVTGRPWTAETLTKFIRKPRNAGLRAYKGEVVGKGTWPSIVDESTWRAAQSVLDAPGRAPGRKAVRRHLLTGVALCGKCGHTLAGSYRKDGRIVYVCKKCHGVSILADNVEPIVYRIVGGRLAMPDAIDLIKAEIHDEAEAEAIRAELNTLYGEGLLTGKQAKIATDLINEKIAKLRARQQDQERLRVLDGIPLGKPEAAAAVRDLSPDRFRAVVDLLMTITVAPVGKSGKVFNPERVRVVWL
jgi:DNA invertase Pin-like site-specific DNA recombinase